MGHRKPPRTHYPCGLYGANYFIIIVIIKAEQVGGSHAIIFNIMEYTTNEEIQRSVMRRVYVIYLINKLRTPVAVRLMIVGLCFGSGMALVSFRDVVSNMPSLVEFKSFYRFVSNAFLQTEVPVKIIVIASVAAIFLLTQDALHVFRGSSLYSFLRMTAKSVRILS